MFAGGKFGGKHVFMEDLLSQPVNVEMAQPIAQNTELPQLNLPDYGEQESGLGALLGGLFESLQGAEKRKQNQPQKAPQQTKVVPHPQADPWANVNTAQLSQPSFQQMPGRGSLGAKPPSTSLGGFFA